MSILKNIEANLDRFGLSDMTVTAEVEFRDTIKDISRVARIPDISLMELCAEDASFAYNIPHKSYETWGLTLSIYQETNLIGYIDSDFQFNWTEGSLRNALGWALATDGGGRKLLTVDLDQAVKQLLELATQGDDQDLFFNTWMQALKGIFAYEEGSRFSDGYLGVANLLWRIAQKEMGHDHPGYRFMS